MKSEAHEMGAAYAYITRLDAELEYEANSIAAKFEECEYTQNGLRAPAGRARIYTEAETALIYFDARYGAYAFGAVKEEIEYMHSQLHSYSAAESEGAVAVSVLSKGIGEYIEAAPLTASQKEMMALAAMGISLAGKELASPVGASFEASERWGWRAGPAGIEMHSGIDIPAPAGSQAKCALAGTVSETGQNEMGMYAIVASVGGRQAEYAGLESLLAREGQAMAAGDPIGLVGQGENGYYSLHFAYSIKGEPACPAFFIEGYLGARSRYSGLYLPPLGGALARGWIMPASGAVSSFTDSRSGSHAGYRAIDIALPEGSSVYASQSGTVSLAEYYGDYGNCVIIEHEGGYSTLYGHLSGFSCYAGQAVAQGDAIGPSGNTGRSTGPHLHFEIRLNGARQDLRAYFDVVEGQAVEAGSHQ